ncbi:MAG: hypothetical protein AAGA37_10830 [Actinomycetota bacterium]
MRLIFSGLARHGLIAGVLVLLAGCSFLESERYPSTSATDPATGGEPDLPRDAEATVDLSWWFDSPCPGADEVCLPPRVFELSTPTRFVVPNGDGACGRDDPCSIEVAMRDAVPGDVIELGPGEYPANRIVLDTPDVTVQGAATCCHFLPSMDIEASGVRLLSVRIGIVDVGPKGDSALLAQSRFGSLFINGADDVQVLGNRMRPREPGLDVVQVKARDGDGVDALRIEGNIIGPQDSADGRHTDCVQLLDGAGVVIERNIVLPCGDKAFQIRSGAGGIVEDVALRGNAIFECAPRREGCNGFHAIVWASTDLSSLELRHNTILGSLGISSSGSTVDPGDNLTVVGNLMASTPCGRNVDNVVYDADPCAEDMAGTTPVFVDSRDTIGDVRLASSADGPPRATESFGPGIDGLTVCAAPRIGAALDC